MAVLCVTLETSPILELDSRHYRRPVYTDRDRWPRINAIWICEMRADLLPAPERKTLRELLVRLAVGDVGAVYGYNLDRWIYPCLAANMDDALDGDAINRYLRQQTWHCAMRESRPLLYFSDAKFASLDKVYNELAVFGLRQQFEELPRDSADGFLKCWKLCAVVEQIRLA